MGLLSSALAFHPRQLMAFAPRALVCATWAPQQVIFHSFCLSTLLVAAFARRRISPFFAGPICKAAHSHLPGPGGRCPACSHLLIEVLKDTVVLLSGGLTVSGAGVRVQDQLEAAAARLAPADRVAVPLGDATQRAAEAQGLRESLDRKRAPSKVALEGLQQEKEAEHARPKGVTATLLRSWTGARIMPVGLVTVNWQLWFGLHGSEHTCSLHCLAVQS